MAGCEAGEFCSAAASQPFLSHLEQRAKGEGSTLARGLIYILREIARIFEELVKTG
jgi:hypothetical protein